MHSSDRKPFVIFIACLILCFGGFLLFVKNCGTDHDRAVQAFVNYSNIHHIEYDSYDCGIYPNENNKIICTYDIIGKEPVVLSCEYNLIGHNICYPVIKIY